MKKYQCIITITPRSKGGEVVEASKRSGAQGGTIVYGKGSGAAETKSFLSGLLEPEKAMVITLVELDKLEKVKKGIQDALHIGEIGKGIIFVLDVEDVVGLTKIDG